MVTASSGNVFTDLGFDPGEAAVMDLHADLMARLRVLVQTEGWTQAQAAERFGISQSRVSDRLRGKWDKCSLNRPITLAARAQQLQLSQSVFAAYRNASISTVQKWENGEKKPTGTSLRLLSVIERRGPEALI